MNHKEVIKVGKMIKDDDEFDLFIKRLFEDYKEIHPNTGIESVNIIRWVKMDKEEK